MTTATLGYMYSIYLVASSFSTMTAIFAHPAQKQTPLSISYRSRNILITNQSVADNLSSQLPLELRARWRLLWTKAHPSSLDELCLVAVTRASHGLG